MSTTAAVAQTGNPIEGALDFLLPVGARSLGMGEAAVASAVGTDGIWWNPAVVARGPREFGLHIARSLATPNGDATGSVVYVVQSVGAFGLSVRYLNYGQLAGTDSAGQQNGTFANISTVVAGTFAAPFGDRFSAGITLKFLQITQPCTGVCNTATTSPRTGALDLGAQYILTKDSLFMFGAAVRSLGLKLQVNDSPQADALPSRADVGLAFAPRFAQMPKEARIRLAADLVKRISGGGPGFRLGGEVSWLERLQARAGYVVNGSSGTGPTLGLGFVTGRLQIDFAQTRSDLNADSGQLPTYLSVRYIF